MNIRSEYLQEVINIENDAIIECMLAEIEVLEMRHQYLATTYRAKLNDLGVGNRFEETHNNSKACMRVEVNTSPIEKRSNINFLTICKTMLTMLNISTLWGWGGGFPLLSYLI